MSSSLTAGTGATAGAEAAAASLTETAEGWVGIDAVRGDGEREFDERERERYD